MTSFADLALIEPIQRALAAEGYTTPTPIQAHAIPPLLEGRDLLGLAQTGTGKTAAFALPILQRLEASRRRPAPKSARVLVLTPTRELAVQIEESFRVYGRNLPVRRALIFGGVGQQPQVRAMSRGVDVLIATPGRLLDLIGQGHVQLDKVEMFVLDEADRMLDMGFINDIRKIVRTLPVRRQTLLFSATMPDAIADLAGGLLNEPVRVEVTPPSSTVDRIDQSVLFVEKNDKRSLLAEMLKDQSIERAIVFTRTKHGANRVAEHLEKLRITADAIHGNKSQGARQAAIANFRMGRTRVLVATDIAARGIDIDGITHVINFELPNIAESYVHRIGRTARAGANGVALSFCDQEERAYLRDIQKLIGKTIEVVEDHPFRSTVPLTAPVTKPRPQRRGGRPGQGRPQRREGGGQGAQQRSGRSAARR
ncbi:DEAD/DEAH box helicase [Inquilinus sp. CAU 1745]|uniref:DEAD/DEAH box helicase n=1 Tax=Inquilinus sp. CAU 1745 TaxID=3140369 RepID=UPI00325BEAD1